ncbi:hypothetical protein F4859DRAFT_102283 [Xylaria cf. heliscus]|nr:hypothetical protein F4859DRAFT_102283 [Xylaria cf. heliscus]
MANRLGFDLKTFEISNQTYNFSLSMTSVVFIYDVPFQNITQDDLCSLIQSKQLWLLPRGLCQLDVHVQLGECGIERDERAGFFDFIAGTICQCFLWSQLGLSVEFLGVQYHQEEEGNTPDLYFSIEQSDMSSALLSPPHAHTAQIKGLECILRFESSSNLTISPVQKEQVSSQYRMTPATEASADCPIIHISDTIDMWENAALLVEAALCVTFGTRRRMNGLKIIEMEKAPSLLDLAPAIWNSHYLRSTLNHTKNFPVISSILASSLKGQSPELRRKGAMLIKGNVAENHNMSDRSSEEQTEQLELSIQRRLWDLLQDTLKPTIGTSNAVRKSTSTNTVIDYPECEMDGVLIDDGAIDQYYSLTELHRPHGNSPQPSGRGYDDYKSSASYNSDTDLACRQIYERSQDNQLSETPGFQDQVGSVYYEAGIFDDQLLETDSQYLESDSSYNLEDHRMSDYIYDENDDIYGHRCQHTGYAEPEPGSDELTAIYNCWENQGKDDTPQGAMGEIIHGLEADDEYLLVGRNHHNAVL